jgi:putative ABC transport system permease protein
MQSWLGDVRYCVRVLLKTPGFTAAAVITLGLCIGANTAIFSMVSSVLLKQLPFEAPDKLVWIWSSRTDRDRAPFSIPDFFDFQEQSRTVDEWVAFSDWNANLTNKGEPERLQGLRISPNVFRMLGVNAAFGRTLLPEDDSAQQLRVAVLSHGLWVRRFGGDTGLINSTITLNGDSYVVVGVLPQDFFFPNSKAEIAIPARLRDDWRHQDRDANFLRVIGRLKSGVTIPQAKSDLDSIAQRLQTEYPKSNARKQASKVVSLHEEVTGNFSSALLLLLAAIALVLLIGCMNLATLLLARASARRKEVAIRTALGARRLVLVRQLLTETVLIGIAGGIAGVVLAWLGLKPLIALSPTDLPRVGQITIDGRVLAFTIGISLFAGVVAGLLPALQTSKSNLSEDLKEGSRGSTHGASRGRAQAILVVFQLSISMMLLIGAGLLIRSFSKVQATDPGFNGDNLLTIQLSLPQARYPDIERVINFNNELFSRLRRLPGVESVGATSILPLSEVILRFDFTIVGSPPVTSAETPIAHYRMITPDYFSTMGIRLAAGRDFTDQDRTSTQPIVIINKALAQQYWPNASAVGAHLMLDDGDPPPRQVEVVGVVEDVKHFGLDREPPPEMYVPMTQVPKATVVFLANNMFLAVRTANEPMSLANIVRSELRAVDGDVPVTGAKAMNQLLATSVAPRRFNILLLGVFGAAALVLASAGLYGLISYSVTQRTHEAGIRMALGARPRDILKLIVFQGLKLVLLGVAVGSAGAFALTFIMSNLMSTLLFGVDPRDLSTFVFTSALLACIGLLASYIPARKATKVDPVVVLRSQ